MSKYIKKFTNHSQYESFTGTSEFILPNVSLCVYEDDVHYNPRKAIGEVTVIPSVATGLVYNATSQSLLATPGSGTGTMMYKVDSGEWNSTLPTATNATSYTVYYKAAESANYFESESGSVIVNIAKLTPTVVAPTAKVLTYNGSAQELVNAGSTDYGTLQYKVSSDSWSTSIPTRTRGGSYTVQYRVVGDSNINDVAAQSVQCSINEKHVTATVTLSQTAYTYNGSACEPSVTVSDGGVVIDPSEYTVTYSNNINAGTGTVTISDNVGGDYEVIGSSTFTINKANSSLSFTVTNITIMAGKTGSNVVTVNAGDGTVTYSSNNTSAVTVDNNGSITGVSAGNATITANISSTSNYNSASTSYTSYCVEPITAKFNVTDTIYPTRIASATTSFTAIEIDGVKWGVRTGYTFSTTGEHTVKYTLTDPTTIGDSAFSWCTRLTSITIPDNVTSIGDSAFYFCSGLTSIDIPNSVTSIGNNAFYSCYSLTSCTIGSGVTSIGYSAFTYCYGLTSIVMPDSVTSIGIQTFRDCSGLTRLNSDVDGVFNIPSGVTSIGDYAFYSCYSLTSCTIGSGVTSISSYAFSNCTGLTNCTIGSGVTSIGGGAFSVCNGLTSIDIPNSVTSIGDSVFKGCSGLTTCTIGSGVTSIGNSGFTNCISLTTCTIGSGVTSIGNQAFYNCSGLTSITIPNSVTSIGNSGFTNCASLTSIDIPDSVTSIGGSAFYNCTSLTSCTIGSGVTSIGDRAFDGCNSLTSIEIPSGVTSIGNSAFYKCSGLTSIVIPDSVTSIGNSAFYYCSSLTSCIIGSGVTSIGNGVFYDCSGLTSVTIGSGVISIDIYAFRNCSSLTSIVSNAVTAPTIKSTTFQYIKTGGTLTVPIGSSGYDVWMGTGSYYLGFYNWTKVEQ